jgi:alkylation response protein AidB-like acyl-CoA dehydrogenase
MRDFLLDDAARRLRAEVGAFFARELAPRAAAIEADGGFPAVREAVRATGAAGYLSLLLGEHHRTEDTGVAEPGLVHAAIVSEEAAALSYAFESTIATSLSCALPLRRHATAAVRAAHLGPLARGEALGAICITEPGVGSDSAGMATRIATDAGTGDLVVHGIKRYISNAGVAEVYIVYGISDTDVPAQRGMTAVVVPGDAPGLSFPRSYTMMGRRGCVVGEVALDGVRVPADHILGEPHAGFRVMVGMFNLERILLGGAGLGLARAAFDIAREHARSRHSFGAPLGAKQLIWERIAELSWRLDAAELLTYRAARAHDDGCEGKALMREAAMAKLVATQTAVACADAAVQILGGDGLTKDFSRAEQLYRDARAMPIVGGTSEMAKYVIASRDLPDLHLDL